MAKQPASLAARTGHTPRQNAINAALLVAVALPWAFGVWYHTERCGDGGGGRSEAGEWWCGLAARLHPVALVNVYFFFNVCVLFWVISLVQRSTWLIDPYWTLIPLGVNYTYQLHAGAGASRSARAFAAELLLWLWSARLTHSYFRREEWNFGAREDWRFADYRARYPRSWWLLQFPVAFLSQQAFLVGVTLPLYSVHFVAAPWSGADTAAAAGVLAGLALGWAADTQLFSFVRANERREARGLPRVPVLDTGVWRYSRRPNYFAEQLVWWSLGLFAWRLGHPWALAGAAVNSACLFAVTGMVEERMLARPDRRAAYREYMRTTSMWLPLPKFRSRAEKAE
jgi:steroid 5-alpha reductase family enzyme